MDSADHDPTLLVDLSVDGALDPAEREALRARVADDGALRREERELKRLHEVLAAGRVTARPGFATGVMAALPESAPWADRRLLGWRSVLGTLAAVLALALGAFAVAGATGTGVNGPGFATARAVAAFATSAALSGAGLLAASWRGVGMAVAAALDLPATVAFGIGVVAVNALLIALLRRPRRRRAALAAAVRRRR